MFTLPGSGISLPAVAIRSQPTRFSYAWAKPPVTCELHQCFEVLRVTWRNTLILGDWFALGDTMQPRDRWMELTALPHGFRYSGRAILFPGTILDVGKCSSIFEEAGGDYQAEFIDGPQPKLLFDPQHETMEPRNRMQSALRIAQ